MQLTPEERQRIYEEEKARMEAQAQIAAEAAQKQAEAQRQSEAQQAAALNKPPNQVVTTILLIAVVVSGCWAYTAFQTTVGAQVPAAEPFASTPLSTAGSAVPALPDVSNQEDERKVVVQKGWRFSTNDDAYDYIRGSVKNGSARSVSYWKVTAHYFDKKGQIVDTAYTNALETLPPGAAKRFEIMHSSLSSVKKASVFVEEVRF